MSDSPWTFDTASELLEGVCVATSLAVVVLDWSVGETGAVKAAEYVLAEGSRTSVLAVDAVVVATEEFRDVHVDLAVAYIKVVSKDNFKYMSTILSRNLLLGRVLTRRVIVAGPQEDIARRVGNFRGLVRSVPR